MNTENKIQLAVFDWAGTTVDYGSSAPMVVFEEVFADAGISLARAQINGPMGMEKKAHIRSLLSLAAASEQWNEKYGREWNEKDVESLYEKFEGRLAEVVAEFSKPIEGVIETMAKLREMGIKIGSTTGYNAEMMKNVLPGAAEAGYTPDCVVTPDLTGKGRPTPFMLFECMRQLDVHNVKSVVKVGDTIADILEGKNAGAWNIGLLTGSNLLGLTQNEYEGMDRDKLAVLKNETARKYLEAGADLVIDNMLELPAAIETLNARMKKEKE